MGLLALAMLVAATSAQELPVRGFNRADGLPNEQVRCLQEDRRGFLWIGTADGLCRFDGTRFVRYGGADGLAQTNIGALAIGAGDDVYVGMTGPWLAHYVPDAVPRLHSEPWVPGGAGRNINKIACASDGRVFCTTEAGAFVAAQRGAAARFECVHADARNAWYGAVATLADGSVLYATSQVLVHFAAEATRVWPRPDGRMRGNVWQVEPREGHVLLVEDGGVVDVGLSPWSVEPVALPALGGAKPRALVFDAHGDLWLGTTEGLLRAHAGATESARWVSRDAWVRALACDREGNLWIGTDDEGLRCISALPFDVVPPAPGTERGQLRQIAADGARILVADEVGGLLAVEGDQLVPARGSPDLIRARAPFLVVDGAGGVWRGGADGIVHADGGDRAAKAPAVSERRVPLALCADRRGRVFCRTRSNEVVVVTPEKERSPTIVVSAMPADCAAGPALGLDAGGRLLVGTENGLCLVAEGETRALRGADGRPLLARWLHEGPAGDWWLLARDRPGLARLRGLDAPVVDVRWFGREHGLPDGMLWFGAEDRDGELWFAGPRGLTRFEITSGRAIDLPWPTGLAIGVIQGICVAADARVYVSTGGGLVRFDPARLRPSAGPRTFIDEIELAGTQIPVADGGVAGVPAFELPAARAELSLHLCAPGLRPAPPRFQSRLLPLQAEFSTPRELAAVQLAGLASGAHRLQVRAITFDGVAGPQLEVRLDVLPPFWRRPPFLAMVAAVVAALAVLLHRFRVRRLLAMESVRRQVATDLHDDLGSGLAQVAMLGEVAKRTARVDRDGVLDEIAHLARSMRDSLADIVWAVDPQRDELSALVHRLRHVAANLFPDEAVALRFTAPDDDLMAAVHLPPDRRRNVFLIVKEALANCARHAQARQVEVAITIVGDRLRLVVADDGVGFDPTRRHEGAGLASMARRAAMLGTTLSVQSVPGEGTRVEVVARMR